ncbi:hypothetical protein OG948_44130 (plasmid) [Embleya sp. NBC_00888]|uniref:hypothetical protein n=1 Tax=Embleya sp. NBC_00888 TaxID=2975960 RepID=UPI002F912AAC|nr:hypothetical protein OG948_44130 [Embleya sp. NBC_00888]
MPSPCPSPSSRLRRLTVAAIAAGAATFAGAGMAHALPMAPGDNGDVKVHKSTTSPTDQSNEPKVCQFNLAAFNFDGLQSVTYTIAAQPADGNGTVLGGNITLAADGTGHTATLSLPNGQYKLVWTFEGEQGAGKQKVFRVDCPNGTTNGGTTNGSTGGSSGGRPVGSVNAGGGGGGSQVDTGEVTAGLLVGGAALGGFAFYLHRRRRATGDGSN